MTNEEGLVTEKYFLNLNTFVSFISMFYTSWISLLMFCLNLQLSLGQTSGQFRAIMAACVVEPNLRTGKIGDGLDSYISMNLGL